MGKLPLMSGKDMVRFLERQHFALRRVRGSHHVMRKGELQTVVPVHGNQDLRTGTLQVAVMVEQAQPSQELLRAAADERGKVRGT